MAASSSRSESLRRFFSRPPGHLFNIAVVLLALQTLWVWAVPAGPDVTNFIFNWIAWLVLGGTWAARMIAATILQRRLLVPGAWKAVIAPVVVVATAAASVSGVAMLARFSLSRGALQERAIVLTQDEQFEDAEHLGRVGLYEIVRAEALPTGVRFEVNHAGFIDWAGFAYSPEQRPSRKRDGTTYYHLDGPWYMWVEHF